MENMHLGELFGGKLARSASKTCRRSLIWGLLMLGLMLLCDRAHAADPLIIKTPDLPVTSLSGNLSVFVDKAKEFSPDEVLSGACDDRFEDNRRRAAAFGFTKATVWARFKVVNSTELTLPLIIELAMARLSHATWYLVQEGQVHRIVNTGVSDVPKSFVTIPHYPNLAFALLPGKQVELFLRAESNTSIWFPLQISSQERFELYARLRLMLDYFLIASCFVVGMVSIVVAYISRQRLYWLLAFVATDYGSIFAIYNGHVRSIYPGLSVWWERQYYAAFTTLGLLALLTLDRRVFQARSLPKAIAIARKLVIQVLVITSILHLFLEYRFSASVVFSICGLFIAAYMLACLYVTWSQCTWLSFIWFLTWLLLLGNFISQQISQSIVKPHMMQTLLLPGLLGIFLIGLIREQISFAQTQIKLAQSLQSESEARLAALRSQLDPHFLFNILTSITFLSEIKPSKVPELVDRLASFLRHRLQTNDTPFSRLIDEIETLRAYIDIEKVRFGDLLRADFDVQPETHLWDVPEMILQPLVENAIKHGSQIDQPFEIIIKSSVDDGMLRLEVINRCSEIPSKPQFGGFGIGISNTRQRLTHLYGDDAQLELLQQQDSFTARIRIPSRV